MKYLLTTLALLIFSSAALAEGMVYDPTEYTEIPEISKSKVTDNTKTVSEKDVTSVKNTSTTTTQNASSFNNALFELDSAQVNIRNELLDYKAKYQEIDTQYQLIKEQRKNLADKIKNTEKKINNIERSKNNIRKTMI